MEKDIDYDLKMAEMTQVKKMKTLIDNTIPKGLRWLFYHFSGLEGTHVFSEFATGEREYFRMIIRKENKTQ